MTSWAVSTNNGTNFTDKGPILPVSTITKGGIVVTNGASDPMHGDVGDTTMAYDSVNNVVYLFVNSSRESTNWYGGRLWISTDKGQTFDPVNMDVPGLDTNGNHRVSSEDKPMIRVNLTNIYAAASQAISGGNGIWAAHSENRGTNWDLYHTFESTSVGDVRGADIAVVPDGTVYFFWLMTLGTTNQLRYAWLSTNNTWSLATNIGPQLNCPGWNGSGNLLRSSASNTNDYFIDNSFPHVVYASGKLYVAYADLPSTNSTTDRGDIFIIEAAVNWTTHSLSVAAGPRRVNNDGTQTDQWNPSICANPSGTELFIGYYSRQNDPVTNSWIMAYGAKAYISNGLSLATFECFPVSSTNFQPLFAGTSATASNVWTFEPVWPAAGACIDTNDIWDGWYDGGSNYCAPFGSHFFEGTGGDYVNFAADDYTWCAADANYFYFAWCDRTRIWQNKRPDADIKFAKIRQ